MKRIVTIIVIIISILVNCLPIYATEEPTVNGSKRLIYNIVKLYDMEYTKPNAYISYTTKCTLHLKLIWVNRITHYFEGDFWTTDGYTYYEHISGSFNGDHLEFGLKNKKDAIFEYYLNDSKGKWTGNNTFEAPLMGLMDDVGFSGQANAYKESLEANRILLDEELYKDCRDYSAEIYKAAKENSIEEDEQDYINQPKKLKDRLKDEGYKDVKLKNFKDDDDSNVSYVIAHKRFQHPDLENVFLERVIVVIRGTDTVEWLGNMKICPPDSQGNEDKYTFANLEGTVHANFMEATKTLSKDLIKYIEKRIGKDKNTQSKIVVTATGHSRGGAVSNLLARTLVDDNNYIPNVTAYTFATPSVAYCSSVNHSKYMESYTNIYNFCKNKDFIPFIPLVNHKWSFWKFGETYIEKSGDNDRYCNKITDIMAKKKYAPTIEEYYNYKFEHKKYENISMNLYYFMQLSLSVPMIDGIHPFTVKSMLSLFDDNFKGMSELSNEMKKDIIWILFNHWQLEYKILKYSDYKRFTYCDALALCSVGGLTDEEQNLLTNSPTIKKKRVLTSTQNALNYTEKFNDFFNCTDAKGVKNIEKLGWDISDLSTWNGITFNEIGEITDINLEFLYLCGSLDLSNLDKLVSVDVSANYLTDVNVNGCTSLQELNVSDNELATINTTTNKALISLNCGYNNISELDLSNNTVITDLDVASCLLSELNISNLTNLSILNCMDNKLTKLDTTLCPQITELYCIQNFLDINDDDLQVQFESIDSKPSGKVVSEFQYLPEDAQFDEDELQQILAFAVQNENLQILDDTSNVNFDSLQNYFGFKQYNGVYHVESIYLADESVIGNLNCNNFKKLKYINISGTNIEKLLLENCSSLEELYCSNNELSILDLNCCQNLQVLNCQYGNIKELIFPSNIFDENNTLYQIDCEYNYLDTSIFTETMVDYITFKAGATLEYENQKGDNSALVAVMEFSDTLNSNDYTESSFSNFSEIIEDYEDYENLLLTQTDIDEVVTEILTSINSLEPYLDLDISAPHGTFTVTYDNEHQSGSTHSLLFGTPVTLTATADEGYVFDGWYEKVTQRKFSSNSTYTFKITTNMDLEARFVRTGDITLTFTNDTGQVVAKIDKSVSEWNEVNGISDLIPEVPYKLGHTNGRWNYSEADVLTALQAGNDVTITPIYDASTYEYPTVPTPTDDVPAINLYYSLDADNNVGSFTMAAGIPQDLNIEAIGIGFYYKKAASFNPSNFILNINNKMLTSRFDNTDSDGIYIVNIYKFTSAYNWCARGYITYYDENNELKTVCSNQINIVDRVQII